MISKGLGDARRVLGTPQSWIDMHFAKPAPPLPEQHGDPLLRFVCQHLREWEQQVVIEAQEYRHRDLGPAMVRYAHDIRRQCAAIRLILHRYGQISSEDGPEAHELRRVIKDLASTWSNDVRYPDEWRT
jgi:hypothetical protein